MEYWYALSDALSLNQLGQFHFLRPWWWLFMIPAVLLYRLALREPGNVSQWRDHMSPEILKHLVIEGNTRRWFSPRRMFLPFLLLVTIVLAGPTWRQQPSPFLVDESVLVVALDLSSSMREADLKPSRLLRAKQKVNDLLDARGGGNTAVIALAGSAHLAMPITRDRDMASHILNALDWQVMPRKSKDLAQLIPLLERLLQPVAAPATVLLLTDRAANAAVQPFADYFASSGRKLVIWSVTANQGDTGQLNQLAEQSNATLVPYDATGDDIGQVNRIIRSHMVAAPDAALPWEDAGYFLLFLLATIHVLWFRKGWTLKW